MAVLGGMALFYAAALVAIVRASRRYLGYLARQPRPLAAALRDVGEDRAGIRTEN